MSTRSRWAFGSLAFGCLWLHTTSAKADPVLVLLGPDGETPPAEVLLRVQGELVADGYRVEPVSALPDAARPSIVRERCVRSPDAITAGLFVDERSGDVEMLFCQASSRRQEVRRERALVSPTTDSAAAVARHTVDLLRVRLFDFLVRGIPAKEPCPPAPPPVPPAPVSDPEKKPDARVAVEMGVGILAAAAGAAITPLVRIRITLGSWFQLRLSGAGLGTRPTVETARGSASIEQALGVVEASAILAPSSWLRPAVSLGAGAYTAHVTGSGVAPYGGSSSVGVTSVVDAALGFSHPLTHRLDLAVDAHVLFAEPGLAVRFIDVDAAQLGQPMVLITVSLVDWI